ncbi:hypothetical protein ACJIZ3_020997 [Penstemon smallii]|uniref:Uncharacterized protein n=1 Tax=Penstemon smallii TaxID=265156 RepID=A0ABD3SL25_9LAMI
MIKLYIFPKFFFRVTQLFLFHYNSRKRLISFLVLRFETQMFCSENSQHLLYGGDYEKDQDLAVAAFQKRRHRVEEVSRPLFRMKNAKLEQKVCLLFFLSHIDAALLSCLHQICMPFVCHKQCATALEAMMDLYEE